MPVWGFATVTESRSANAKVGERFYGYLPMSTLNSCCSRASGGMAAFSMTAPHRAGLAPVYNNYVLNTEDALYAPDTEALQVLFRPLFMTSFLIDDFLADNGLFRREAGDLLQRIGEDVVCGGPAAEGARAM